MGFNWGGKKWRPANVPKGQPKINQSIEELLKPLSEKKWKGNVWGSQIMNVEKETTPDVSPSPTPSVTPSVTPSSPVPSVTPTPTVTPTPSRTVLTLNQAYQGGRIVYILQSGDTGYDPDVQHGLIMTTTDTGGINTLWGCQGTNITGTTESIGSGQANTTAIVNQCATAGIAARICDDLSSGGYSDWYLPSKDEWYSINANYSGGLLSSLGFSDGDRYWTSSQYNSNQAWYQEICCFIASNTDNKNNNGYKVRAVRSF
jgi:hypothetical protein